MRWFQHNNQAIFGTTLGRNPRREVKQVSPGPHLYDNKDENHVDDQENDMTNNSKEEEEKTV
jgi:hypothetical protein